MIMRAKTSSKPSSARMEKKKKSSFVYKRADPKKVHERANQTGGQYDGILKSGVDVWRPKEGDNGPRILPATWDGHDHFGYDVWVHERVGVDKGSYPCLQKMLKKRCPVCEAALECAEAGEEEEAKALQPKRKVLCYIVDRADDNLNPSVWVMGWTMDRDITALCENKKTGKVLYIDHPDEGYDVSFKRKGTQLNTRYIGMAIDRDPSPISESTKQQDGILEFITENPLPSLVKFYDAKYLEKIIQGTAQDKDEDLDEDEDGDEEEPTTKKKKPGKKKPARDEAEDEDDDEEAPFDEDEEETDEDPDDDVEEEPKKKPAGKKKPVSKRRDQEEEEDEEEDPEDPDEDEEEDPEDPDEDEEEDTDDEEEEKPKGKVKRKPAQADDDDDEEEEDSADEDTDDDDGDEEEEQPKRRVKPVAKKGRR